MKNHPSSLRRNITSDTILQSSIKKNKINTNKHQNYFNNIFSTQTYSNFYVKKYENKENFNSNSIRHSIKKITKSSSKYHSSLSKDKKNFNPSKLNTLSNKKLIEKCNIKYNYAKIKVNKKHCNNKNKMINRAFSPQTYKNINPINSIKFKNIRNEKLSMNINKIINIQHWWKEIYKIIILQKNIKSYLSRKKYQNLKKIKKFIQKINFFFYSKILKMLSSDNYMNINKKKPPSHNAHENERKKHKRVFSPIPHSNLAHSNINNCSMIINLNNNISNLQELFSEYFTKKNTNQSKAILKYNSNKSFINTNNNISEYSTNNFYPIKINKNIIFRNSANNTINSINTFTSNNNSRYSNSFLVNEVSSSNKNYKLDMKFEPVKYLIKCKRNFNHWKNVTIKKKILNKVRCIYLFNKFIIQNYYKIFYDKFRLFYRIKFNLITDLHPTDNTTNYSNNITYDLYSIKGVKIKKIISNKIYILSFIINMVFKMNNKHILKYYLKKWKNNLRTVKHIDSKIIRFAKSPTNNNRIKIFEENSNNNIKISNNKIVYKKKYINFPKNKINFEDNIIKRKVNQIEEREINFSPGLPRKTFGKTNNINNYNNEDMNKKKEIDRGRKIIIKRNGGIKSELTDYCGKSYSQHFYQNKSDILDQ